MNSFCGSFAYAAPEVLSRAGYGKAVGWYLLGVISPYFSQIKLIGLRILLRTTKNLFFFVN